MRATLGALGLVLLLAVPAAAAEWGEIKPGVTTQAEVRARYGAATRTTPQKVEGYDTQQWLYEAAQAPAGITKLIVDFGLLTPSGYKPELVRAFRLEPKPEIFNRKLVVDGWGPPTRLGKEGELEFFLYEEGLLVYFSPDGNVLAMIFTPPQKIPSAPAARPQR